jgi:hypothetical protein
MPRGVFLGARERPSFTRSSERGAFARGPASPKSQHCQNGRRRGRFQAVSATSSLSFSTGLRNPRVFRGRSFKLS